MREIPHAPRARILLGQLQLSLQQAEASVQTLRPLFEQDDPTAALAAATLAKAALACGQQAQVLPWLVQCYERHASLDVLEALLTLSPAPQDSAQARQHFLQHLQKQPSLLAAARWLAAAPPPEAVPAPVQKALDAATRPLSRYRCAACGFEAKEHFWHCPGCQAWDSYPPRRVEEL